MSKGHSMEERKLFKKMAVEQLDRVQASTHWMPFPWLSIVFLVVPESPALEESIPC